MDQTMKTKTDWPITIAIVIFHLVAIIGLLMPTAPALVAFGILYAVTVLGITVGFHRYFVHRSFKTYPWVGNLFAVMGTLALQGGLRSWVAHHRMHHAGSDTEKDPHNAKKGFWYSHVLWLFRSSPEFNSPKVVDRYSRDISASPFLLFISKGSVGALLQIVLGVVLLGFFGVEVMLWGIFVRLVAVYHVTWAVNSICHMWGYQNTKIEDLSQNNPIIGLLAFGEGWHNNHHAFADSARHGLRWFEVDLSWWVIRAMRGLNLAWDVKEVKLPVKSSESEGPSEMTVLTKSAV